MHHDDNLIGRFSGLQLPRTTARLHGRWKRRPRTLLSERDVHNIRQEGKLLPVVWSLWARAQAVHNTLQLACSVACVSDVLSNSTHCEDTSGGHYVL